MPKLVWKAPGQNTYRSGLDLGVLFPTAIGGVPWNGLVSVEEQPSGGEVSSAYFDGNKYLDFIANEDFSATLTAFAAPYEFGPCDGTRSLALGLFATQQPRVRFGLSYRILIGNDLDPDAGYELHLVYNSTASPAAKAHTTRGETTELEVPAWVINSVPPPALTYKPTAHFIVNSTIADPVNVAALEALIYGTDETVSELPSQEDVIALLSA